MLWLCLLFGVFLWCDCLTWLIYWLIIGCVDDFGMVIGLRLLMCCLLYTFSVERLLVVLDCMCCTLFG